MDIGILSQRQPIRPVVLTILSGGGFTFETERLLRSLGGEMDFVFLRTVHGGVPGTGGLPHGEAVSVPQFATKTQTFFGRSVYAFAATLKAALSTLRRFRATGVIGVGCSHTVPMLLASRILGLRSVYVESITRVDQLSATGKIVYRLRLASVFIVQWPELKAKYPAASLGTIL